MYQNKGKHMFCILKKQHNQESGECSFITDDDFTNTRKLWVF